MIAAALRQLRVTSIAEDPSAEDHSQVGQQYDDMHAELRDLGIAYWTNTGTDVEEIPSAIFRALVNILSFDISDTYGKQPEAIQDNNGENVTARVYGMRQLRRHIHKRASGEATPFSSY